MNKQLLFLTWILGFAFSLVAQENVRLISDIGLLDNDVRQRTTPPDVLVVGIDVTMNVLYKLSDDRGVIKGGQFLKGFNAFSIDVGNRFEQSGAYAYTLELKAGAYVVQKKFKIDIRIDLPHKLQEKQAEAPAESEHVVSMYVGGQLVVSYRKLHTAELSEEIAAIPRPYKIDPYDAAAEPSPDTGFPILGAAVAAYQVIKGLLSKKDSEAPTRPVVKKTQISRHFPLA
jgi:hypothetical protein